MDMILMFKITNDFPFDFLYWIFELARPHVQMNMKIRKEYFLIINTALLLQ